MFKKIILLALLVAAPQVVSAGSYTRGRVPLTQDPFIELPVGSVRPQGWILLQLETMRDGLTGHLDEAYPQVVGQRNAWLGGDGDAWERGPYWIDGLLPLAYMLDDPALKAKAQVWVEAILSSQDEDGYFGPSVDRPLEPGLQRGKSHDWWPKMVVLKILKQYYSATGDSRVIPFLDKYFRYQLRMLPEKPLDHWSFWGAQRGGDNLEIVYWLYDITGEEYLLELGELIHSQTTPWIDILSEGTLLRTHAGMHCVNLGQGFKEPVIYYRQSHDPDHLLAPKKGMDMIRTTIGLPTGLWGGDEKIRSGDPVAGSELCTAVEMMYSLEEMLKVSADTQWADALERIAYNVLPAQVTDDFSARQYFQQFNQIECSRNTSRRFTTPHADTDQVFGLLNGFPCCTCNMHQSWPKYVQNLWYATSDDGLAALVYAPSSVTAEVAGGIKVHMDEDTFYPFDENIRMSVSFPGREKCASFPLRLRIPDWCHDACISVNGDRIDRQCRIGEIITIDRKWKDGDVVDIRFPMNVACTRWFENGAVIERGPLIYALKMDEKWVEKQFSPEEVVTYGASYFEVTSDTKWNYCLKSADLVKANIGDRFRVVKRNVDQAAYPWNVGNAPISIMAPAAVMEEWTEYRGSAGPVPYSQNAKCNGENVTIELIPYGCTTLRIAEFPIRN